MSGDLNHKSDPVSPQVYQIEIKGQLDKGWADWFEGMAVTQEDNGITLLTGPVIDQSALHGLLKKVRDLGLPLLSVNIVEVDQAISPANKNQNQNKRMEKK
jgi:hypothetical protein